MLLIKHQRLWEVSNIFGVFLLMSKFENTQTNLVCYKSENGTTSKTDCINYRKANEFKAPYNPLRKTQDFPPNCLVMKFPINSFYRFSGESPESLQKLSVY